MSSGHVRKPAIRTTEDLHLTVPREIATRAKVNAQRLGLTPSDYVGTLVRGEDPVSRPAADMQDVALAGNRIVRAIGALESVSPNVSEGVRYLREAQQFIAAELEKATPTYEAAIARAGGDDHWGDG